MILSLLEKNIKPVIRVDIFFSWDMFVVVKLIGTKWFEHVFYNVMIILLQKQKQKKFEWGALLSF